MLELHCIFEVELACAELVCLFTLINLLPNFSTTALYDSVFHLDGRQNSRVFNSVTDNVSAVDGLGRKSVVPYVEHRVS